MANGKIENPVTDEPVRIDDNAAHTEAVTTVAPISDADSPARLSAALAAFYDSVRAIYGDGVRVAAIVATPLDGDTYHFHINGSDPKLIEPMVAIAAGIVAGKPNSVKAN